MALLKTYSPRSVSITYAGLNLSKGYSDGDFLTIAYNSDRVNIREGFSGDASVAVTPNHSAIITYTVFPESESAKKLVALDSALRTLEKTGQPVAGALPFVIADKSNVVLFASDSVIMTKAGDMSLGETTNTQEFTFYAHDCYIIPRGIDTSLEKEINDSVDNLTNALGISGFNLKDVFK